MAPPPPPEFDKESASLDPSTDVTPNFSCSLPEKEGCQHSAPVGRCCSCDCPQPDGATADPVRYWNGELQLSVSDFGAGGYGFPWGQTRRYNNRLIPGAVNHGIGVNWLVDQWPHIFYAEGLSGDSIVVTIGEHRFWFDEDGSDWVVRHGFLHTLEHDGTNDVFILTYPDGSQYLFNDFDQTTNPQGSFLKFVSPNGVEVEATSYNTLSITEVQRSVTVDSTTTIESIVYDYFTSGTHDDHLEYATLRRKVGAGSWMNIRRAEYAYYGSSETYGPQNALKTVELQQYNGASWDTLGTHYYRYYKDGQANGFEYGLKFVLMPEAYKRLDDAVADPLTATDAQVDDYADYYFEYDGSQRVTKEITRGGSCTWTFAYSSSANADAYNNWKTKTTVTKPGGEQEIVYANYIGQVLLKELKDGSDSWIHHWTYDATSAQAVQHRHPSSISSYSDASANLNVSLNSSAGRIDVFDYYSSTSGSGVKDYKEYDKVKEGSSGTEIKLKKYEYTSRTANSITIYPISKQTVYRNDNGTGAIETTFSYSWHSSSLQMEERVTTLPVISTAQNGSNSANSRTERFDEQGNLIWVKDERGFITRYKYDAAKGVMTQMIQDVDHTEVSDEPSGWTTPSGGGLHLVSDYEYDDHGRQTQTLGPAHEIDISGTATSIRRARWTVYDDVDHEVRSASGYGSGGGYSTYTLVNPVSISKMGLAGRTIERIQATRASTSGKLLPSDTFAQSTYVRWSTMSYDDKGHMEWSRVYHDIPSSGTGSSGTNYNQSNFEFTCEGEQIMSKMPGGTITRTVYDVRGNAVGMYVGTDDTGATESDPTNGGAGGNNMKLVTENEFDGGSDGGDNHLTEVTQHVDASNTRVTSFIYDFRGRQTAIDGEIDFYQINTYDTLGQVTRVDRKNTTSGGTLIARSDTKHDDLGRVYQSIRYAVDPVSGTVGNTLTDNTWYDSAGNVIKSQPAGSQAFTKAEYDSLGRAVKTFVGYDTDESTYVEADDVAGDTIFEQKEIELDEASNVIRTILRRRFHDATGTGELTDPSGSQPKARVSYVAMYPDALGRTQAVANYGTNGGSSHTRCDEIPARSDNVLVGETFYDDAGQAWKTIDPADKEDRVTFDDAGRRLRTIENYTDGDPTSGNADEDRTVAYTYNTDGQVATITAKQQSTSDDQVKTYVYGTTLSNSDIARADLLRAEVYPDSDDVASPLGDGPDTTYDRIEYKYNRLGQRKEMKDQNGTVHAFDYDKLGRGIHDRVTSVGYGVDGALLRLSRIYDVRGFVQNITSYDNAMVGSGNVVNDIEYEYNDFGVPVREYQSHSGAVNTGSTPKVEYSYANGSSNHIRLSKVKYPNGRILRYEYDSGDDELSRPSYLADDNSGSVGTHLAEYSYLGKAILIEVDYTEPDLRMDLAHGNGDDPYDGPIDRFGRVTDMLWRNYGASFDTDRVKYGYDRRYNRLWRDNPVAAAQTTPVHQDELYDYDGLNRLVSLDRGDLNGTKDGLVASTKAFAESWTLDPVENWTAVKQDTDGNGSWDLDQDRTHNKANEIVTIDSSSTHVAYDRAGNMIKTPKPDNWSSHFDLTFDAWNRLVVVEDGDDSDTIAEYEYDAGNRRTLKRAYINNSLDHTRHYYYSRSWQILEERVDAASNPERQYVWGLRYINDLILRDRDADANAATGELGSANSGLEERIYALSDPSFNIVGIADEEGQVVERMRYTAFGSTTVLTPTFSARTTSDYDWTCTFSGSFVDNPIGVHLMRHRSFQPSIGRFVQRDPLPNRLALDSYSYVRNSPIRFADPLGLTLRDPGNEKKEWEADNGTLVFESEILGERSVRITLNFGKYTEQCPICPIRWLQFVRVRERDGQGRWIPFEWSTALGRDGANRGVGFMDSLRTKKKEGCQPDYVIDTLLDGDTGLLKRAGVEAGQDPRGRNEFLPPFYDEYEKEKSSGGRNDEGVVTDKPAVLYDFPVASGARLMTFITCAVCVGRRDGRTGLSTLTPLACLGWQVEFQEEGAPIVTVGEGPATDILGHMSEALRIWQQEFKSDGPQYTFPNDEGCP